MENEASLQDITSVIAIAGCYCTVEPYVDSKYDLYIQKIGNNYRTFVYAQQFCLSLLSAITLYWPRPAVGPLCVCVCVCVSDDDFRSNDL